MVSSLHKVSIDRIIQVSQFRKEKKGPEAIDVSSIHQTSWPLVMPESADVAVTTMLALLIIADISGNCLVCLVIKKNKDMRTPFNYLLVNLAVSDIMFATFIAPNHVFEDSFTHPKGTTGLVVCLVITAGNVAWIGAASSSVTLTAIAVERYCTVTSPDGSNGKLTKKKLKAIISGCWIFSVALNMPLFLATRFDSSISDCKWIWPEKWIGAAYDSVWLVLLAIIPLTVMTGLYSKVVYMLWFKRNEENEVAHQQKGVLKVRKRVTLSVITVSAIFGACWITGLLIYILSYLDILLFGSISYVLSDTLFMFNSAINPFVYALLNERFRQKIKMLCRTRRISRVHTSSKHGKGPQNNTSPVTDTVNVQ